MKTIITDCNEVITILWEDVIMNVTFAIGRSNLDELILYYVYNVGDGDIYEALMCQRLFPHFHFRGYNRDRSSRLITRLFKRAMKEKIISILTSRVQCGTITIEQIQRLANYEKNCNH